MMLVTMIVTVKCSPQNNTNQSDSLKQKMKDIYFKMAVKIALDNQNIRNKT